MTDNDTTLQFPDDLAKSCAQTAILIRRYLKPVVKLDELQTRAFGLGEVHARLETAQELLTATLITAKHWLDSEEATAALEETIAARKDPSLAVAALDSEIAGHQEDALENATGQSRR